MPKVAACSPLPVPAVKGAVFGDSSLTPSRTTFFRVGRRRMMWFQREEPGSVAASGVGAALGGGADGGGAERDKESSANQAFRRSGQAWTGEGQVWGSIRQLAQSKLCWMERD